MSEIDWSKPIHYDGGEYPCMITLDNERFVYVDPADIPINVIITTPKGRWLCPLTITKEFLSDQANWMSYAYDIAVRHYERRNNPNISQFNVSFKIKPE
jgi:hypothetical protein